MRTIDPNTLNALHGSRTGDELLVWVWYDGQLAWPEKLKVSHWSIDWDDSREWQNLDLTVEDPTGELAPWLLEDPLGVGGARLQLIYSVGGAGVVNLGWYRVTKSKPTEAWAAYTISETGTVTPNTPVVPGAKVAMVPMGSTIQLDGNDLAIVAAADKFLAPESPVGPSPTVLGEIKRLLQDRVPVTVLAGVTDTAVNSTLIYKEQDDRWAAVQDLAARISAGVRMNGDGQCEVYPITSQSGAIALYGGPGGLLVKVDRGQDYTGLYNIFIADGTATINGQQQPVRGTAQITGGPLRVDGPHGRVPKFYSSTMLTTQQQCDDYAAQMRDTQLAGLTTDLIVTTAPLPHLQVGDWVTVAVTRTDTGATPLTGRLVTMAMSGSGGKVDPMVSTVRCTYADVQAAFAAGGYQTIAGPVHLNQPGVPASNASPALYPYDSLYPYDTNYPSGG